jgi:hypothetical protein
MEPLFYEYVQRPRETCLLARTMSIRNSLYALYLPLTTYKFSEGI